MSSIVNRQDNLDDCIKLTDILSPTPAADLDNFDSLQSSQCVLSNEDTIKFGLFADQLTALKMIENQGKFYNIFSILGNEYAFKAVLSLLVLNCIGKYMNSIKY